MMRFVASPAVLHHLVKGPSGRSSVSGLRYFGDSSGRVLSEEERARENVYIQKMERERLEKMKKKTQKENAEKEEPEKKAEGEAQKS